MEFDERVIRVLEWMSDAFVCLDEQWRFTYVNRRAGEILGRDPEALIGRSAPDEFPQAVGHPFHLALEQAARERRAVVVEGYYPPLERWLENRIHPHMDCVGIFFNDVTERRRLQEELRHEAAVRAQAERMASLGFWQWDVRRDQVTWSEQLHRIYGLEPDGAPVSFPAYLERVHPDDRDRVRATIEGALRDHAAVTFEERIVRPDGAVRHLRSWAAVAVDDAGEPTGMFGTCLDLTQLMRTSDQLQRSEEWLDLALEAARIALFDWDVVTDRVTWSRGVERVTGVPPAAQALDYGGFLARIVEEDRARVDEEVQHGLRSGSALLIDYRIRNPEGELRWISGRARVFRDADGRALRVAGSLVDVTEQRWAEQQQRDAEARLRSAQKMEALGRLAAGVAHDFNNLLTVISSAASMLARPGRTSEAGAVDVDNLQQAALRAGELTRQLLTLSRQQVMDIGVHELDRVTEEMARLLARILPTSIEVRMELGASGCQVRVDRSRLEQVILNLAVNARDAMADGGVLTIGTSADVGQVCLQVSDTGVGMTAEVMSHIFEPFYTTRTEQGGTGLGLATAYGIVTQSGGRIEVASAPGHGATFTVVLPRADGPEPAG